MQNKINHFNGRVYETRVTLAPGERYEHSFATSGPFCVFVHALGAGVSATVSVSGSPSEDCSAGTAIVTPVLNIGTRGVVTDATAYAPELFAPSMLRVDAAGGTVVVEVLQ